jgi:hypothetical protein
MFIPGSYDLSMTCRAVDIHPVFFMARSAKSHINRVKRLGKRKGHVIYIAVTILAGDFSERNVPSVGKIGIIGYSMNLDPRDLLIFLDVTNQFLFFFAICHCFFMTILANLNIGDGSFLMGKYFRVTVKTVKSRFFYMLFMVICDRLGKTCRIRTVDDKGKKNNEDSKQFPFLHRISMEIGGDPFLSYGVFPQLSAYQKIQCFTFLHPSMSRTIVNRMFPNGRESAAVGSKCCGKGGLPGLFPPGIDINEYKTWGFLRIPYRKGSTPGFAFDPGGWQSSGIFFRR